MGLLIENVNIKKYFLMIWTIILSSYIEKEFIWDLLLSSIMII